ncbi:MAG: metallophosphoesterase [Pseudomonadota bacterium]
MKIAHISDLHFGKKISTEKLHALKEDLLFHKLDLVIVTGDITDRGKHNEFHQARLFLDSLCCEYLTIPGNREVSLLAPWELIIPSFSMKRHRSYFGKSDQVLYKSAAHRAVMFGLNSVSQFPSWPGSISRESRYWFREEATNHKSYFKVLFLHHPVLPVLRASSFWAHQLSDASALLTICAQCGVRLILHGHKHRASVVELCIPETKSSVVISSCGSPLLDHWDSVYHLIDLESDTIRINPREFSKGEFGGETNYSFHP